MPCCCCIGGLPVHASGHYLTDLLRTEMGFEGVVVSDYGAVENVYWVQRVGESKGEAYLLTQWWSDRCDSYRGVQSRKLKNNHFASFFNQYFVADSFSFSFPLVTMKM